MCYKGHTVRSTVHAVLSGADPGFNLLKRWETLIIHIK